MIGLLGILIVLFLGTLALGYKVCLMGSKEKSLLAALGIIVGVIIMIASIVGAIWSTDSLLKVSKMGMMGMPQARTTAPGMRAQRGAMSQPGIGAPRGMNVPPPAPVAPKTQTEEKK
jgi:hypothetical protein